VESQRASAGSGSRPLVVVDIGCRWGLPERWSASLEDLRVYAFDADPAECARLQAQAAANVTYVPLALGEREGAAPLHYTADPACSSLFPPDAHALATFPELHVIAPAGIGSVTIHTLNGWAESAGVTALDAIKLDVQGAELAVLRGASALLGTVRLIEAEVTFNPIYEGQPLFGALDAFLRDRGFVLWRLGHLVHYTSRSQQGVPVERVDRMFFDSEPVEFQVGAGQLTWGHAYYCTREMIDGSWSDPGAALLDARAADLFGFRELAEPAFARARDLSVRREGAAGSPEGSR